MEGNVYYGFLSLLPALIAIVLSIATKNIIISLLTAVYLGALIINSFNPFDSIISMISDFMYVKIAEESNAQTIFMMAIIFIHRHIIIVGDFIDIQNHYHHQDIIIEDHHYHITTMDIDILENLHNLQEITECQDQADLHIMIDQ